MTNAEIIFKAQIKLMNEGIIGTTGNTITVKDSEGNKREIPEPETIHTYSAWKSLGRQVKKGEKKKADILIWKGKPVTRESDDPNAEPVEELKMFMKHAFFFTFSQTEPIQAAN